MDIDKKASENIFDQLTWQTAKRDLAGIAKKLAEEDDIHEVYGFGDAELFDEFFCFLRELDIMRQLEMLTPRCHRKRKRVLKPRGVPDLITKEDVLRKHCALLE